MPRNRTHLPELAPGCTVSGVTASIDRLVLRLENIDVAWAKETAEHIISRARWGEGFRRGRSPGTLELGSRRLRVAGRVTFNGGTPPKATIELRLNLTELLAGNFDVLGSPEALRELDQPGRLRQLTKGATEPRSLDGNSNFFTDAQRRSGRGFDHPAWLTAYVEMVLAFLAAELNAAARSTESVVGSSLLFPLRNWSVRQIEVYWEFWHPDAVGRAAELCRLVEITTQANQLTHYTVSQDRSGPALGIRARAQHRHITHKIYSKLPDRLRFEIAYEKSLRRIERGLSLRGHADFFDLEPLTREVADLAADRANRFLQALFEVEQASTPRGFSTATSFVVAVSQAFSDSSIQRMVWNHLLHTGSVPRDLFRYGAGAGVLDLVRRGYLLASQPGRARMNTTYRPSPEYAGVISALRDAYRPTLRAQEDGHP